MGKLLNDAIKVEEDRYLRLCKELKEITNESVIPDNALIRGYSLGMLEVLRDPQKYGLQEAEPMMCS